MKGDVYYCSGYLKGVRHANGRDWWFVNKDWGGNTFYIFRTTPDTVYFDHEQVLGDSTGNLDVIGDANFSIDGKKFVYTCATSSPQVLDFDRCSGYFSNPIKINVPWYDATGKYYPNLHAGIGANFSPSGRFLYVNNYWHVWQLDLTAGSPAQISGSRVLLASWDSSDFAFDFFKDIYERTILAPNKKMYMSSYGGDAKYLHVVNFPDSAGLSCGFVKWSLKMTNYANNPIPNLPWYQLGRDDNSGCDTILGIAENTQSNTDSFSLKLLSNPVDNTAQISFHGAPSDEGLLILYDALGNEQQRIVVKLRSGNISLHLEALPGGAYFVRLVYNGDHSKQLTIIKADY